MKLLQWAHMGAFNLKSYQAENNGISSFKTPPIYVHMSKNSTTKWISRQ